MEHYIHLLDVNNVMHDFKPQAVLRTESATGGLLHVVFADGKSTTFNAKQYHNLIRGYEIREMNLKRFRRN